ncbi:MAG: tRNA lysidine(34) synthetase TilS [Candidatus Shikimatogenerans bostrichidophilus]|nr:MAG: tRNA lysidine(34) synthetase TilS [Candidatus Shikimatogenerans bostrichidophilus]
MLKKIKKIFKKKNIYNKKVLLCISGGVDSMVLLNIILKICNKKKIGVINCNFSLNKINKSSLFVKNICKKKKIFFFYKKFKTFNYSKKKKISIQMAARILRYKFFFKIKKKYNYDYLILGHNLDDNIETFFINLFRKTGIYGLKGINYINKNKILRPLIYFEKKKIINYALKKKIKWIDDISNNNNIYFRNKIRNLILPIIYKNILNVKNNIYNTINNLNIEYKFIKNNINKYKKKYFINKNKYIYEININKIIKIKYYYYILYKIFNKYKFNNFKIFKKLPFLKSGKILLSSNNKYVIYKKKNKILLTKLIKKKIIINNIKKIYIINNNIKIKFKIKKKIKIFKKKYIYINLNKIKFPLYIKNLEFKDYIIVNKKKIFIIKLINKKKFLFEKKNIYLLLNNNKEIICTINNILILNKKYINNNKKKQLLFKFFN